MLSGYYMLQYVSQQTQNTCITFVKHLYNICKTSAQRLRRWSNIVQMLYKCFVFAGMSLPSKHDTLKKCLVISLCLFWQDY